MDVVLGLDAGGTKILAGLVGRDGAVRAVRERATPRVGDRCDPGLVALQSVVADLLGDARAAGARVRGVGLGMPEYVRDGVVTSAEVFAWERQPGEVVAAVPGMDAVPVVVEADVRCAALAEARARAVTDLAYLSWGTGLSWTQVAGGRCADGARGEALALGEWPVDPRSGTVWDGTLEGFASGLAIQRRYAQGAGHPLEGGRIEALAAAGDEVAETVLASAAEAVAWAVAGLVHAVDPRLVVLGGGVAVRSARLPQQVARRVPQILRRPAPPAVEVALAGGSAGLVGAALTAWSVVDAL